MEVVCRGTPRSALHRRRGSRFHRCRREGHLREVAEPLLRAWDSLLGGLERAVACLADGLLHPGPGRDAGILDASDGLREGFAHVVLAVLGVVELGPVSALDLDRRLAGALAPDDEGREDHQETEAVPLVAVDGLRERGALFLDDRDLGGRLVFRHGGGGRSMCPLCGAVWVTSLPSREEVFVVPTGVNPVACWPALDAT